ncbi:MAG: MG2 domain-containing protein, partial [Bacteroidales bacterium]|nr:MG2 domain-containing protein [Bacteroidales bacterium]
MRKLAIGLSLVLFTSLLVNSCKQKSDITEFSTPQYNSLISAFTSGIISAESSVKIRFAESFADSVIPGSTLDQGIINLSPKTEGSLIYLDQQTIEFRPDGRFRQGTAYDVDLRLDKLFTQSKGDKSFKFRFHTIEQHLTIALAGFRPYNDYKPELNKLSATLQTTDVADPEAIESMIDVVQGKRTLPLSWDHDAGGESHYFTIDSIRRGDEEFLVEVKYDGAAISSIQKGVAEFKVPALGDFKVIDVNLIQYPEQHVQLSFSDPIRKNQSLDGLIRLSNDTDSRFIIEGNIVKVYPNVRQNGTLTLFIEPGIRNTAGKGLKNRENYTVVFDEIKPALELIGNGVIIPSADDVLMPFKAVNIKAVDVKVIKIYENNIAQFLQVNELSGNYELKRAGRLILKKTIDLVADKPIDYGQWNTFSLNLTKLIKTEPGSIYRVELNFRQSQSMFSCDGDEDTSEQLTEDENFDDIDEQELSYWDSYEGYYSDWDYYYYDGYSWEDREDPCKPAYYGKRRAVAKNILASNLGVIAKYGSGQHLNVTVTDLLNAQGLSNSKVTVYNYQQQELASGTTDGAGMTEFDLNAKPFLVVAEQGGQKGYLRLVDGAALSYSMFDVSGSVVNKGIKGFLYGERGVWRPGDSIFVNLILNDKANPIPDGHPVNFELKDPQGKVVQKRVASGAGLGFYTFHTKTASDAPTGRYSVIASIGGVQFTKLLQVETIKPNRLKIDLSFDGDTIYPARGAIQTKLMGKWLTGATARNLRSEIEVVFKPISTSFKGFEAYTFTNSAKKLAQYANTFWRGNIDDNGIANFSKQLNISGQAPGMLNAIFTTRIFEKSGDFSIDQKTVPCSPYNTYVGIKTPPGDKRNMLLTDTSHTVNVVTLSSDGEPVTKIGLDVKVYKLSWRWWWDSSTESLASYMGSSYQTPIYSSTISTKNGKGSFDFRIDYPEWGRYLVMASDKGGHSAAKIVYVDWPGWAGRSKKGDPDAASVLSFSSDKSTYTVGETATITIPSSAKGSILISLENGSRVLRQEWIEAEGSETRYSLKITPEMTPNIYVYASLIQPHKNTENDLPIRMFGVIPIKVEDSETMLYPEIDMPDELSPKSKVQIKISEKYNKKFIYTIAIVDEGLLDLTRFRTPNPWSGFYAKEALGVKTWDMFEYVLGAYGGRIDGIYSIGGGDDESGEGAKDANRFPPMVKFIGPFTHTGKTNTHNITMPNYIGSVRTMVIAGNKSA